MQLGELLLLLVDRVVNLILELRPPGSGAGWVGRLGVGFRIGVGFGAGGKVG